jgi:hypothetical protein
MPKGEPVGTPFAQPPIGYKGPNRFMNWHGNRFEVGFGASPFFLREIEKRKNNIEACIVGIFGGAGRGKSYIALRLAEIIDKNFDPDLQVAFGSEEFLKLISPNSPLKMGQVIIVDEAQFSAGSRNWYNEIQKDLMAHLEAVRSMGFIIFIVALNLATLDVIARNYTLTHMIYMKRRGRGIAYRFYNSPFGKEPYKNRLGIINTKLPDSGKCRYKSCLRCPYSGIQGKTNTKLCNTLRARYERKKREYLATTAKASEEKRQKREEKTKGVNYDASVKGVDWTKIDKLKNGRYDPKSICIYSVDTLHIPMSEYTARMIRAIKEKEEKKTTTTEI